MSIRVAAALLCFALISWSASPAQAQDADGDGVLNAPDNCDFDWNPAQGDLDGDTQGDACDLDPDGDGLSSDPFGDADNCPHVANANQAPSAISGIGAACPAIALPADFIGINANNPIRIPLELDSLPPRPEIVVDVEPVSAETNTELQIICRGADENSLFGDQFGFLGDYTVKVDEAGLGLVDRNGTCRSRQQQPGTWVAPIGLLFEDAAFDNTGDPNELACFLLLRRYGGGTIDVHVRARTLPPRGTNKSFCATGCDDTLGFITTPPFAEYGCFAVGGTNFRFLDRGNPVIGQCNYVDANPQGAFPEMQYTIVTPNQWDCCIWQYDLDGVPSEKGFSNFWTGAAAPPARPDADLDGILQRCDNCQAVSNANQRDADADGPGDFCDACPFSTNNANSDVIPAGNACQCSDVDHVGGTNLVDVVHIARFQTSAPDSPAFDPSRCRVSAGLDPIFGDQCANSGLAGLRLLLARGESPVESCP